MRGGGLSVTLNSIYSNPDHNDLCVVFGGNNGITMAMFEGFDTDRNKLVDLHECFAVLVLTAKLPVVTRLRLLFELHDENGDDELSKVRGEDLGGNGMGERRG